MFLYGSNELRSRLRELQMTEILEPLLDNEGIMAEYSGDGGYIYATGADEPIGKAEGITAKVKIHIKRIYNGSSVPSDIQTFSMIEGNISKLSIADSVIDSRLGNEGARKIRDCLRGSTIEGHMSIEIRDMNIKQLRDCATGQSFGAKIEGVRVIILLPSIERFVERENEKYLILKNVAFVAKDIKRTDTPEALSSEC